MFSAIKEITRPVETLGGYTLAIITVHNPGLHILASLGAWPDSECSKTVEVGCSCSDLKLYQRKIAAGESGEEEEQNTIVFFLPTIFTLFSTPSQP